MPTTPVAPPKNPSGIGGWLLVFIVALSLGVFVSFGNAGALFEANSPLFGIAFIALAVTGVFAVVELIRKKARGVAIAKDLLLANIGVAVFLIVPFKALAVPYLLKALIGAGIWYAYLSKSKRVKNTYGL